MSLFTTVLESISKKISAQSDTQKGVQSVLEQVLVVPVTLDTISIRDKKVFITATPTVKLAIKLKEKKILSLLKDRHILVDSIQ